MDASVIGGQDGFQLAGRGCVFTRDRSPNWDTMTAEEVVQALQHESWLYGVVQIEPKHLPATYIFKTSRGESGLLQVLGATNNPSGWNGHAMNFRYRLVQTASLKGKQAEQTMKTLP